MTNKLSAKYQLCGSHTADTIGGKVHRIRESPSNLRKSIVYTRPFNWLFRINGWRFQPSSRHLCFTGRRGSLPVKSQVVLLQTAHSWANAGVLLGARLQRISHASGAGELSKQLNFRRYVLCSFPTNMNSHARMVPIFARHYYVDIRSFERQRLKYTFALFRSHFECHN